MMTYQEKKSVVSLFSSILIFAIYCMYKYRQFPEGVLDTEAMVQFWGTFVLVLTVVSIAAHIVISIMFNIIFRITTGEKEPSFADELDKLIDLKAYRNSFLVFVLGFLIAMGSVHFNHSLTLMFLILIASGFLSDVTGSLSRLYHYRRGV